MLIAEVVKQQKRIEVLGLAEAKGALKLYPGALNGGLGLNDLFYWTERHMPPYWGCDPLDFVGTEHLMCLG
jgi:hypothetical protein